MRHPRDPKTWATLACVAQVQMREDMGIRGERMWEITGGEKRAQLNYLLGMIIRMVIISKYNIRREDICGKGL